MTVKVSRGVTLIDLLQICFQLPPDEREQYEAFTGESYLPETLAVRLYSAAGPKWTITADDVPVFAAGFLELRPGVWQDWAATTPAVWADHWRPVTRIVRGVMDEMLQTRAHRLQCVSLASRVLAHRWYGPLGLEREGPLRGYGANGEDAIMFARLRSHDGS